MFICAHTRPVDTCDFVRCDCPGVCSKPMEVHALEYPLLISSSSPAPFSLTHTLRCQSQVVNGPTF